MLYATTRSKNDVFTAHKVIHQDCAGDGGLFLPLTIPKIDISHLSKNSFSQNVADVLNVFFSCGLTGLDVEFAIGRAPVQMASINGRILVSEAWHNSHWNFTFLVQTVSDRIRREGAGSAPGNWVTVAVRIAVIFAVWGMAMQDPSIAEDTVLDVAVTAGDFSTPIAAWYCREMGLPIGNIICGCNANGAVWELLHRGQLSTSVTAVRTCTPEADLVIPRNLERLIHQTLGQEEADRYIDCCRKGAFFALEEEHVDVLRTGMFASVISDQRVKSVINNVYRTSGYVLSPYAALAHGSLSDYRAKTGESRTALLFSECSPVRDDAFVAAAMDISVPELEKILNLA